MKRRLINPPGTEKTYQRWQYSQAVRVGDTIWVSGQVGMGKQGPAEGIEAQTQIAMESLRRVLEEMSKKIGRVKLSMHQDVERGRDLEVDAIVGAVVELARKAGVETPTIDAVHALVAERAKHLRPGGRRDASSPD